LGLLNLREAFKIRRYEDNRDTLMNRFIRPVLDKKFLSTVPPDKNNLQNFETR
jgi:hypothetical protein